MKEAKILVEIKDDNKVVLLEVCEKPTFLMMELYVSLILNHLMRTKK